MYAMGAFCVGIMEAQNQCLVYLGDGLVEVVADHQHVQVLVHLLPARVLVGLVKKTTYIYNICSLN